MADAFDHIMKAFLDEDERPRFPVDDIEHFLPWVLVTMGVDVAALDDGTVTLFVAACEKAGVTGDMDADAVRAAFEAYYDANPPNPAMVTALQEAWREANAQAPDADPFSRFAGDGKATGVLGGGVRPAGTIPGAMARLQTISSRPPKKS